MTDVAAAFGRSFPRVSISSFVYMVVWGNNFLFVEVRWHSLVDHSSELFLRRHLNNVREQLSPAVYFAVMMTQVGSAHMS